MPREAEITTILVETDRPEVVIARDAAQTMYLTVLTARTRDGDEFVSVPISPNRLRSLLNGEVTLRSALVGNELNEQYQARFAPTDEKPTIELTSLVAIPERMLPKNSFDITQFLYFGDSEHAELVAEGIQKQTSVGVLSFNPPESVIDNKIDAARLSRGLALFQRVLKYAHARVNASLSKFEKALESEQASHMLVSATSPGSFRIHFESQYRVNLSGQTAVGAALAKTDEITRNIDDADRSIEILRENRGHIIAAYRDLLQFVAEEQTPLKYVWFEPGIRTPIERRIGVESARRLHDAIAKQTELVNVEKTVRGAFLKVHTEDGTWILRADGERVSGRSVDGQKGLLSGVTVKTVEYELRCIEKVKESKVSGRSRTTLFLREAPRAVGEIQPH